MLFGCYLSTNCNNNHTEKTLIMFLIGSSLWGTNLHEWTVFGCHIRTCCMKVCRGLKAFSMFALNIYFYASFVWSIFDFLHESHSRTRFHIYFNETLFSATFFWCFYLFPKRAHNYVERICKLNAENIVVQYTLKSRHVSFRHHKAVHFDGNEIRNHLLPFRISFGLMLMMMVACRIRTFQFILLWNVIASKNGTISLFIALAKFLYVEASELSVMLYAIQLMSDGKVEMETLLDVLDACDMF